MNKPLHCTNADALLAAAMNRRGFLRQLSGWSLQAGVGTRGIAPMLGALSGMGAASALAATASSSYRALVCVYLYGGNDAFNLIVPTDSSGYALYRTARPNIALANGDLLPITPRTADGHRYGLHPAMPELKTLFDNQRLAVVANLGSLLTPTTKADYQANRNLPPQLFSHSDQTDQWMSVQTGSLQRTGWGGRLGDLLQAGNVANGLSMNISIDGNNLFQTGSTVVPYSISPGGVEDYYYLGQYDPAARLAAFQALLDQGAASSNLLERQSAAAVTQSRALGSLLSSALAGAPALATAFPDSYFAQQLQMVARLISVRSQLGAKRQIFFVTLGGFDTHDGQLDQQAQLYAQLSQALSAFYAATVELGVADAVTTFTESDFGRTLSNNDDGTDHGWGSHHLVMGAAVRGGDLYGRMPDLTLGGPDDADAGRMIPSTSIDQYAATLGSWLGASSPDLATLFPNLSRFATANLGFLNA